jgi:serine protease Do
MKRQKVLKYFLLIMISFCAGTAGAISLYKWFLQPRLELIYNSGSNPGYFPRRTDMLSAPANTGGVSFVKASEVARPCVVYIKVQSVEQRMPSFWDPFGSIGQVSSSGSGVIISPDGYIVTNNHVVKNANKIEVILNNNKHTFIGKVIGIDASSDLALIKIEAKDLPHIEFANSDNIPIGDWVLAVGNPFNLTSTVTAGIVSAKGRNINLVHNQFPIESFIQTDAAINPGNSGGALVNVDGNLVGINTAILSETGSYAGYGFAIPSNIVKKVVNDLKEFGYLQRAFIEANIVDIDDNIAGDLKDDNINGVYVAKVYEGGNADEAGLKKGDIIIKVNDALIDTRGQFDEQLAYYRPGDKIKLLVKKGSSVKEISVTLTNLKGTTHLERDKVYHSDALGADLSPISKIESERYGVKSGIRISNLSGGGRLSRLNLQDGFIITSFNGKSYTDPEELANAIEKSNGSISIQGINLDGSKGSYSFFGY